MERARSVDSSAKMLLKVFRSEYFPWHPILYRDGNRDCPSIRPAGQFASLLGDLHEYFTERAILKKIGRDVELDVAALDSDLPFMIEAGAFPIRRKSATMSGINGGRCHVLKLVDCCQLSAGSDPAR
jgi:hypothetical protein